MNFKNYAIVFFALAAGCAAAPAQDPLKNTKKLVVEGHATLYNNGAFQIPATTIHLIPPGPSALDLALELAGVRAAQSFQLSVQHAKESVEFSKLGIEKSLSAAQSISAATDATAAGMREISRRGAQYAAQSPTTARRIVGATLEFSAETYREIGDTGESLAHQSIKSGGAVSAASSDFAQRRLREDAADARAAAKSGVARVQRREVYAWERFVKGYAAAPKKLGERVDDVAASASLQHFVDGFQRSADWRAKTSTPLTDIMVDTTANYGSDVKQAFKNAGSEISEGARNTGITLAALKSLRWVLQGLLWEASIKPIGKLSAAALGYITVNAVAYPALITINEGVAVANVAVQVAWNSAGAVYDITAPTAIAALAGLYGVVEFAGSEAFAAGKWAVDTAVAGGAYAAGQGLGAATTVAGYTAGKTVQYIGAPLAAAGVAGVGTAAGVVIGGLQATEGGLTMAAGVAAETATQITGKTAAIGVGAGGAALSVAAGTAMGTYELSKAVIAPVGYELGGGLVLSYGTLSQLGAQTVLAVSDAAYVVLSLEGPNWVLYAVRGKLDKGEQIPTGTLLDLKAMQQSGEEFYTVPASPEEVRRVVNHTYQELPLTGTAQSPADK